MTETKLQLCFLSTVNCGTPRTKIQYSKHSRSFRCLIVTVTTKHWYSRNPHQTVAMSPRLVLISLTTNNTLIARSNLVHKYVRQNHSTHNPIKWINSRQVLWKPRGYHERNNFPPIRPTTNHPKSKKGRPLIACLNSPRNETKSRARGSRVENSTS